MPRYAVCAIVFAIVGLVAAAQTARADCYWEWRPLMPVAGINANVSSLVAVDEAGGTVLYAAGGFSVAGDRLVEGVVRWDGSDWSQVGDLGPQANPDRMILYNGQLVAAAQNPRRIVRWTGSDWEVLGMPDQSVFTMLVYEGELVIGGRFGTVDATPCSFLARWNATDGWRTLGTGTSGRVNTLARHGSMLAVGGSFTSAGGVSTQNVALWDGDTGQYSPLGAGLTTSFGSSSVGSLASYNGELVAAGNFSRTGSASITSVARFDGATWHSMTEGIDPTDGGVLSLQEENLYLTRIYRTYRRNSGAWESFAATSPPFNTSTSKVVSHNGTIWAYGYFTRIGTTGAANIAVRDGTGWSPLVTGCTQEVESVANIDGQLLVGGSFSICDVQARGVALSDGLDWHAFGTGLQNVRAVARYAGDIYAAGTNGIARWNGQAWDAVGLEQGVNSAIHVMMEYNGELIVAGTFESIGLVHAANIARFDGLQWRALAQGLNDEVHALTIYNGDLIAGGEFGATAGPDATVVARIARWDGIAWSPIGNNTGANNRVYALAVHNGELVAGGRFTAAGSGAGPYLAAWNGANWHALGSGVNDEVHELVVFNGDVFAAGWLTEAGGQPVANLARWDGNQWIAAPALSGIQSFAAFPDRLVAGGGFSILGDQGCGYLAEMVAVGSGPGVSSSPASTSAIVGVSVALEVAAAGAESYQWFKDGAALQDSGRIRGAQTAALTIHFALPADAGEYYAQAINDCGSADSERATLAVDENCPGARGDANCDGGVDFLDIDPFVMALFDLPAYRAGHCGGSLCAADTNCTARVDFLDIDPFVECLFSTCPACP